MVLESLLYVILLRRARDNVLIVYIGQATMFISSIKVASSMSCWGNNTSQYVLDGGSDVMVGGTLGAVSDG